MTTGGLVVTAGVVVVTAGVVVVTAGVVVTSDVVAVNAGVAVVTAGAMGDVALLSAVPGAETVYTVNVGDVTEIMLWLVSSGTVVTVMLSSGGSPVNSVPVVPVFIFSELITLLSPEISVVTPVTLPEGDVKISEYVLSSS